MTSIKGILFDKDGTLFGFSDTWADWSVSFLTALAPDNIDLRRSLGDMVGFDWDTQDFKVGSLAVNAAVDEQCKLLATVHPELNAKQIEEIAFHALQDTTAKPVCDLNVLMTDLQDQGMKLGIATNDFEQSAHNQMKEVDSHHYFDFICGFDSGYEAKPAAGMILGFCEKMGLAPHEVAMVGDSTHDLEAGRAAGVGMNVGVLTGLARTEDIGHLADVMLQDISHLPAHLLTE